MAKKSKPVDRGLTGKVVLITGAGNGIGAETARQLTAAGARVALLDRDEVALAALANELGATAAAFAADVTDAASVDDAIVAAATHFGGIDTVVANAGVSGPIATVASIEPREFEQIVDVNLLGVFRTVRVALPYVIERRGYVLMVASIMALIPSPNTAGYAATKAGVEAFGRALRVELAARDVRVGVAYFGLVDTGMVRDVLSDGGLGSVLAQLPAFCGEPVPVSHAGRVMVSGITRRADRVFAPGYVRALLDLRPLIALGDSLVARNRHLVNAIRAADQRSPINDDHRKQVRA